MDHEAGIHDKGAESVAVGGEFVSGVGTALSATLYRPRHLARKGSWLIPGTYLTDCADPPDDYHPKHRLMWQTDINPDLARHRENAACTSWTCVPVLSPELVE